MLDVYEIYSWVPAGSKQYFTRRLDSERIIKNPWEFVGKNQEQKLGNIMWENISIGREVMVMLLFLLVRIINNIIPI